MGRRNVVLVSGYDMPVDFECVYEFKKASSTLSLAEYRKPQRFEKLYMPR